mmetsp:Transcript_36042/g.91833  ORF Transcript_36042/g.91833 Transcript_36042/m.91833 type:complete len:82 (+) Transcript_36042:2842-3087(+)
MSRHSMARHPVSSLRDGRKQASATKHQQGCTLVASFEQAKNCHTTKQDEESPSEHAYTERRNWRAWLLNCNNELEAGPEDG